MARRLSFVIPERGSEFSVGLVKVDRKKIYGDVFTESFDDADNRCELVSIANDGQTLFGTGGIAFAIQNQDGKFVRKSDLIPITEDGEVIEDSESSFLDPIELTETVSVEDYLSHQVKSVYYLEEAENFDALKALLKDGDIYQFPFSYRKGIIVDTAFLLANEEGIPFMIITTPSDFSFLSFTDTSPLDDESDVEEDSLFDFGSL